MPAPNYRFGPYLLDRTAYRLYRGDADVGLTPKLLDLLLHLADHSGALVTKEQLLDALWPGANVTENALAQAVSELRQALDDDAADPQYIKTVARRGYRFIGAVQPIASGPAAPASEKAPTPSGEGDHPSIAVMDFLNVTGAADSAWLSAGIAETVTGDLRGLGRFRIVDRARVVEAARLTNGSLEQVAARLGITLAVVGSYQRRDDHIRITARIVDLRSGEAVVDAKVDGPLEKIFDLQDEVVAQFSRDLGVADPAGRHTRRAHETTSLEAYRAFTEGWVQLETLDIAEIPRAIANFDRAISIDPRYALAYTGRASAHLAVYEATRSDNAPDQEMLERAVADARKAVALDEQLAEAHATLGFVLVSAWKSADAVAAARRAVAMEPTNWRHFFRLGHASWGEERLRAAAHTLTLYPEFAFAHFQAAMVHIARGHLTEAETVLRQGAAVQDRQIGRGERLPGLGLHWLLAVVRLAQDDPDEALRELAREQELARPHRVYGREFGMHALHTQGAVLLRMNRLPEAIAHFERALESYPEHAQSHLGLAMAQRAQRNFGAADGHLAIVGRVMQTLESTRPIESAMVRSQWLAAEGDEAGACAALVSMLTTAPPGFAGWTLPIEPFLHEIAAGERFSRVRALLTRRAQA